MVGSSKCHFWSRDLFAFDDPDDKVDIFLHVSVFTWTRARSRTPGGVRVRYVPPYDESTFNIITCKKSGP